MAYYRVGENLERPNRFWRFVLAAGLVFGALSSAIGFIGVGVGQFYHPYTDAFFGLLTFGALTSFFTGLLVLILAYWFAQRMGKSMPIKAVTGGFLGLWLAGIGYLIIDREPWPEHHEWAFDGSIYKVAWDQSGLDMGTAPGLKRTRPHALAYKYCVDGFSADVQIDPGCAVADYFKVRSDPGSTEREAASEVWRALRSSHSNDQTVAIGIAHDIRLLEKVPKHNRYLGHSSSSSTSTGGASYTAGLNMRDILAWSRAFTTLGAVETWQGPEAAQSFRQTSVDERAFTYHFWGEPTSEKLERWAACREHSGDNSDAVCRIWEIYQGRFYAYSIPADGLGEWRRARNALIAMVEDQRIS